MTATNTNIMQPRSPLMAPRSSHSQHSQTTSRSSEYTLNTSWDESSMDREGHPQGHLNLNLNYPYNNHNYTNTHSMSKSHSPGGQHRHGGGHHTNMTNPPLNTSSSVHLRTNFGKNSTYRPPQLHVSPTSVWGQNQNQQQQQHPPNPNQHTASAAGAAAAAAASSSSPVAEWPRRRYSTQPLQTPPLLSTVQTAHTAPSTSTSSASVSASAGSSTSVSNSVPQSSQTQSQSQTQSHTTHTQSPTTIRRMLGTQPRYDEDDVDDLVGEVVDDNDHSHNANSNSNAHLLYHHHHHSSSSSLLPKPKPNRTHQHHHHPHPPVTAAKAVVGKMFHHHHHHREETKVVEEEETEAEESVVEMMDENEKNENHDDDNVQQEQESIDENHPLRRYRMAAPHISDPMPSPRPAYHHQHHHGSSGVSSDPPPLPSPTQQQQQHRLPPLNNNHPIHNSNSNHPIRSPSPVSTTSATTSTTTITSASTTIILQEDEIEEEDEEEEEEEEETHTSLYINPRVGPHTHSQHMRRSPSPSMAALAAGAAAAACGSSPRTATNHPHPHVPPTPPPPPPPEQDDDSLFDFEEESRRSRQYPSSNDHHNTNHRQFHHQHPHHHSPMPMEYQEDSNLSPVYYRDLHPSPRSSTTTTPRRRLVSLNDKGGGGRRHDGVHDNNNDDFADADADDPEETTTNSSSGEHHRFASPMREAIQQFINPLDHHHRNENHHHHHNYNIETATLGGRSLNSEYTKSAVSEVEDLIKDILMIGTGENSHPGRRKIKNSPHHQAQQQQQQKQQQQQQRKKIQSSSTRTSADTDHPHGSPQAKIRHNTIRTKTNNNDDEEEEEEEEEDDEEEEEEDDEYGPVAANAHNHHSDMNGDLCGVAASPRDHFRLARASAPRIFCTTTGTNSQEEGSGGGGGGTTLSASNNNNNNNETMKVKAHSGGLTVNSESVTSLSPNDPFASVWNYLEVGLDAVSTKLGCGDVESPTDELSRPKSPCEVASTFLLSKKTTTIANSPSEFETTTMGDSITTMSQEPSFFGPLSKVPDNKRNESARKSRENSKIPTLEEDVRLVDLALQSARSMHKLRGYEYDETNEINIASDIRFSVVDLKLPLGLIFQENETGCWVTKVLPEGSAAKCSHIEVGDQLAAIDGISAIQMNVDDITKRIRNKGGEVELTLLRYVGPLHPVCGTVAAEEGYEVKMQTRRENPLRMLPVCGPVTPKAIITDSDQDGSLRKPVSEPKLIQHQPHPVKSRSSPSLLRKSEQSPVSSNSLSPSSPAPILKSPSTRRSGTTLASAQVPTPKEQRKKGFWRFGRKDVR